MVFKFAKLTDKSGNIILFNTNNNIVSMDTGMTQYLGQNVILTHIYCIIDGISVETICQESPAEAAKIIEYAANE